MVIYCICGIDPLSGSTNVGSVAGDGGSREASRRTFLRNAAALGGAAWVAPSVASISRASGVAAQSPVPGCACNSGATALFATGTALGLPVTVGPLGATTGPEVCVVSVGGNPGDLLGAGTICGRTTSTSAACSASSDVQTIVVPSIGVAATGVHSSVTEPCDCSAGTASTTIASLTTPGGLMANLSPAPNTTLFNAGGVTVVANQQMCVGGQQVVRALVITVNQPLLNNNYTIVVAESRAQANACPCP